MHNLLADPLIRLRLADGAAAAVSLPEVYEALTADAVAAFPAMRPHQRHAWHAFLAQLGVIAIERSGQSAPPRTAAEWRALLRELTPGFGGDEPWQLIVADPALPAFMQCPAPAGFGAYRGRTATADDLDILVTAKNHDVKRGVAVRGGPDDWVFALIDLQTMAGFLGAGNYGIARMNGGFSARPCLGLAPAEGGLGAHLLHDMRRMLEGRDALLDRHADYFRPRNGVALLWLEAWDGATALDLRGLDPYFIEICRRARLRAEEGRIVAWTAASKTARVAAKEAHGNLGDFWTPIGVQDGKALSLSSVGFRYDRLAKLILDRDSFALPPAMQVGTARTARWRVVARGSRRRPGEDRRLPRTQRHRLRTQDDRCLRQTRRTRRAGGHRRSSGRRDPRSTGSPAVRRRRRGERRRARGPDEGRPYAREPLRSTSRRGGRFPVLRVPRTPVPRGRRRREGGRSSRLRVRT